MIPWFPLLPSGRCRPNPVDLLSLRADAVALALALYRLQASMQLLDDTTRPILAATRTSGGASWPELKAHLLAALQEIVCEWGALGAGGCGGTAV